MDITKIKASPKLKRKLRVCAYCRVSCDKAAMHDSLASQISHYNDLIGKNPEWEFVGIFADEAYTGTKSERPEFQQMMEKCRAGLVDLILVKSVSRFARNALTALEYTRELKSLGIDVFFESENLHSASADGELILTMTASFAQAESKSVSDNIKWKVKRDFSQGITWGATHMYGYDVVDKKYVINHDEAEMVRKIFDWYLEGLGMMAIAKKLNAEGYKTTMTKSIFTKNSISCILSNECYTGDLLLQKTYIEDYLTKKKRRNKGEVDQYYVENDHEAIISKETFEKVQALRQQRARDTKGLNSTTEKHPFTRMIKCAKCGKAYRHKIYKYGDYWSCATYEDVGKEHCDNRKIPEKILYQLVNNILGITDFDEVLFKKKIKKILILDKGKVEFLLKDGTSQIAEWEYESRKNSWTDEMKEKARQKTKEYNRKRGADGRWQQ